MTTMHGTRKAARGGATKMSSLTLSNLRTYKSPIYETLVRYTGKLLFDISTKLR